jgi:selenocysteine lyase/cysteine desulfurase
MHDWDPAGDACRNLIAPILGGLSSEITLLPAVSVGAGLIAANLNEGDEVVVPDDEFRSVLFPMLAASVRSGVVVRRVPFDALADAVTETTTLVVTSHVRSNGGQRQDLSAVAEAAKAHGARVLLDATHSAGVLPIESSARGIDYVLAAAYKHLLCPRGVAFMRTDPSVWDVTAPFTAGWRSARAPYTGFYGGTLSDLQGDAARFDVSLAWHAWVGARASLEFLTSIDPQVLRQHTVDFATELAETLDLEPTGSSILWMSAPDQLSDAKRALAQAGVVASFPAGGVRISFHVYNDPGDVQYIASALAPFVTRSQRHQRSAV